MIIKIGNVSLMPWASIPNQDAWVRYSNDGPGALTSVRLYYKKLLGCWEPAFDGGMYFLRPKFNSYAEFGTHKYKHHQAAMEQLDKFLIRMGKLTIFM